MRPAVWSTVEDMRCQVYSYVEMHTYILHGLQSVDKAYVYTSVITTLLITTSGRTD